MPQVKVIPLEFWQDPQGDIILVFSEYECSVYFGCWSASGIPADFIGCLSFQKASTARSFKREFLPCPVPKNQSSSYILTVLDSEFAREHDAYRKRHYPNGRKDAHERTHYVVVGHDIYHEILATNSTAAKIPIREIEEKRLRKLADAT